MIISQQTFQSQSQNKLQEHNHQLVTFQPQDIQLVKTQNTSQDIKNSLRMIFMFYSSFGDRQNTTLLKSNKFIKLLSDAQIIPNLISITNADILYHQQTKRKQTMSLHQFQQTLPAISMIAFSDIRVHQAFLRLYDQHFKDLYEKIMQFTEFGEQMALMNQNIDEHFTGVLSQIERIVCQIHAFVFQEQSQVVGKVQWQFLQFLSKFELVPALLTQSQAQLIFSDLLMRSPNPVVSNGLRVTSQRSKHLFTPAQFAESLIIIAVVQQCPATQQLGFFRIVLERMEVSEGFKLFQKTQSRTQSEVMKLLMPFDRYMDNSQIRSNSPSNNGSGLKMTNQASARRSGGKQAYEDSAPRSLYDDSVRRSGTKSTIEPELSLTYDALCQASLPQLKSVFEYYCSLGEPLNVTHLKGYKFNKILLHAGLLNTHISQSDADIIYVKLTGQGFTNQVKLSRLKYDMNVHSPTLQNRSNSLYYSKEGELQNGKMNFQQFLKSLELVAAKSFPQQSLRDAVFTVLEGHVVALEKNLKKEKQETILQTLVELLQDDNIVIISTNIYCFHNQQIQLYSLMQQVFDVYFSSYSQNQPRMDLTAFMKFCLDFELSNCLLSQGSLMQVFYALATLNQYGQQNKNPLNYIDKHQFVEAISIVAVTVYSQEPNKITRIIYLLERMNESQGALKIQKQFGLTRNPQGYKWDLVESIYEMFGNLRSSEVKQGLQFDDIIEKGLQEQHLE